MRLAARCNKVLRFIVKRFKDPLKVFGSLKSSADAAHIKKSTLNSGISMASSRQ